MMEKVIRSLALIRRKIKLLRAKNNPWKYARYLQNEFGIQIGQNTAIYSNVLIDLTRPYGISIGNNVMITSDVKIYSHDMDYWVLRNVYKDPNICLSYGKVNIEDNVYIGANAVILKNVNIGEGSIIAAGSVVTRDVPNYSVVAGVPAKVIRTLDQHYRKRVNEVESELKKMLIDLCVSKPNVTEEDFFEGFPFFMEYKEAKNKFDIKLQLGEAAITYENSHVPMYKSFDEFRQSVSINE